MISKLVTLLCLSKYPVETCWDHRKQQNWYEVWTKDRKRKGLCAGQGSRSIDESLPKPSRRAWPSSVMPRWSNVTLQCQTSTKKVNFVLRKGRVPLESVQSWISTDGPAEFQLTDLQPRDAGAYTCDYYRQWAPRTRSKPSDILLLLVTGSFLKPSLQAYQRGEVTAGDTMTLRCQTPANVYETIMFALLKAGAAGPIQLQGPVEKETDFSLQNVTAGDTRNCSCVYFQTSAPFWASEPSDHLEIWVTGLYCPHAPGCPGRMSTGGEPCGF
ncbi:T-cell-interacting, activating receptor on myeloid cells protein 1 isoform X2 [Mustela putorius furo]|uniref:T-cell-interacting, activating receptor on myeloid cells protein 1 isoform X2 n=1 Tax=Mustela putorius furo TaxID=9669 RepID=UPI001D19A25E|nr:T-cell-interacting, activating receptor on myeloid cells protein 1 isoform X2 [Mustela putorius furo]